MKLILYKMSLKKMKIFYFQGTVPTSSVEQKAGIYERHPYYTPFTYFYAHSAELLKNENNIFVYCSYFSARLNGLQI